MNNNKGFTIIELLVVVAIISVLSAIVLVSVTGYINKGKNTAIKGNLSNLLTNAAVYYNTNGDYDNFCTSTYFNNVSDKIADAGGSIICKEIANNTKWCACSTLKDISGATGQIFCVDSTGLKNQSTTDCDTACDTTTAACQFVVSGNQGGPPPPPPSPAFYASPTGSSSGDGSILNPWDLQTALNQPLSVQPGDTILLREGTYAGNFVSSLTGTSANPIIVKSYNGEWAVLDGNYSTTITSAMGTSVPFANGSFTVVSNKFLTPAMHIIIDLEVMDITAVNGNTISITRGWNGTCPGNVCPSHSIGAPLTLDNSVLKVNGSNAWFENFELTNTNPDGRNLTTSAINGDESNRPDRRRNGLDVYGPGTKIINLVIHDAGQGIGAWSQASNSEYYGNIVYNNGWVAPDRPHGHGVYTQNQTGTKLYKNNIFMANFGNVSQQYGSDQSFSNNFTWEGNTFLGGLVLFGGGAPINNLTVKDNQSYGANINFGYSNNDNSGANVLDNYFPKTQLDFKLFKNVMVTGNTLYNPGTNKVLMSMRYDALSPNVPSDYTFNNNTYYRSNNNFPYHQFYIGTEVYPGDCKFYWVNHSSQGYGYCSGPNGWQEDLGYDTTSTYVTSAPTGLKTFLQPNQYDSNRYTVSIYNWNLANSVNVNISSLNWQNGTNYELHNASDYFGDVVNGTYNGSGSITVPMTGRTVANPIGYGQALNTNTFPEFGTFILIRK